jgi:hypothetical protein
MFVSDVNIQPNRTGLPGIASLGPIVGALLTFGLVASVAGIAISAIAWAIGSHSGKGGFPSWYSWKRVTTRCCGPASPEPRNPLPASNQEYLSGNPLSGNPHMAGKGKSWVLVALASAFLIGGATFLVNFFNAQGGHLA